MAEPADLVRLCNERRRRLGRGLANHRKRKNLTQEELAEQLAYARSTLAGVETGRQGADTVFWERADAALECDGELVAEHAALAELRNLAEQRRRTALRDAREQRLLSSRLAAITDRGEEMSGMRERASEIAAGLQRIIVGQPGTDGAARGTDEVAAGLVDRVLQAFTESSRLAEREPTLVLVGGYAGSGKTEFSKVLSAATGWSLLDKDALTRPVVEALLENLGADPSDRESETYLSKVRPLEYQSLLNAAFQSLECGTSAIATAPFLKELRSREWIVRLLNRCTAGAVSLSVVWVRCDADSMYDYLMYRGAQRDRWKLGNWGEYVKHVDFDYAPACSHFVVDNRLNSAGSLSEQVLRLIRTFRVAGDSQGAK